MFGNFWITMQPSDFLVDVSLYGDGSQLMVLILPS
jgi:hypothetical protein